MLARSSSHEETMGKFQRYTEKLIADLQAKNDRLQQDSKRLSALETWLLGQHEDLSFWWPRGVSLRSFIDGLETEPIYRQLAGRADLDEKPSREGGGE
jgi:hypothetical protein